MGLRAKQIFASDRVAGVKFMTSSQKSLFVPKDQLTVGALYMVPYEAGAGRYTTVTKKEGKLVRALEWNSIPPGLFLNEKGCWEEPENDEEKKLVELQKDHDKQDQRDILKGKGYWPVLTWQASKNASPDVINMLTSCGMFVSCVVQWIEAEGEGFVMAWQLWSWHM